MQRKRTRQTARRRREPGASPGAVFAAGIDAMVDALTTTAMITSRACQCPAKGRVAVAVHALPKTIAKLQRLGASSGRGVPTGRDMRAMVAVVEGLLPIWYERPASLPRVMALSPPVRTAIAASMGPVPAPLILASLSPADIDAIIEALRALVLAIENAAQDASPEDARLLRVLAARFTLIIAALRSGASLAAIQAMVAALIDELLALMARFPRPMAQAVGRALTELLKLLTRLAGGAGVPLLVKALLAAIVFLLAHLATRWVLENCTYGGVRLWDLLDENPIFDWWYGVSPGAINNCDRLYRAFLSFRRQRRAAQAAGEEQIIISVLAQAEARALGLWIAECVDSSERPAWERELARIRALF